MRKLALILGCVLAVFWVNPLQAATICVTATGGGDGTTPASPTTLQNALNTAKNNGQSDTIFVAQGTYVGNFQYNAQTGEDFDLTLEGGWSEDFLSRTLDPTNTILDGNREGGVLSINKTSFSARGSVTIEGFTIRNGFSASDGAGILVKSFPPGTVMLSRNIIEENESGNTGGGFWVSNDDSVTKTGGPIHILGNIIRKNIGASGTDATSGGGRVYALGGFLFSNNLVYGNTVGGNPTFYGQGGGLYVSVVGGPVQIINNTVTGNTAYTDGGGIVVSRFGISGFPAQEIQISNNIVRGNTATGGTGMDLYVDIDTTPGNTVEVAQNDFHDLFVPAGQLAPTLTGNIDQDPRFVNATDPDPANWDLHLQPDSPCVDAGDNAAQDLPATDLEGNPRVADGDGDGIATVDMGAYESPGPFGALIEELQARSADLAGSADKVEQKQKKAVDKALAMLAVPSASLAAGVKKAGNAATTLKKVFSSEFVSHGDLFSLFQEIFDEFHGETQALLNTAQTTLNELPASRCKDKAQAVLTKAAAQLTATDGGSDFAVLFKGLGKALKTVLKGQKSVASCGE